MRSKYVLSEVLTGLWRNVTMTIAMIITMAVSLTMLGASLLLHMQVNDMREFYYGKIEVAVFLQADQFRSRDGISEIVDQQELLKKVFAILGALQNLALTVAAVQGIAALLLVANTIQVAAYSKRREVAVMKLVGASNWFIQLPFV